MTTMGTIAGLQRLTMHQLRAQYAELFGETTSAKNRTWLLRRVAWRLQCLAEGDLSERARLRALELANDADLRLSPPRGTTVASVEGEPSAATPMPAPTNGRLPRPGTVITRRYKGRTVRVHVVETGLAFNGKVYKSLSAVAKAITGSHCNGYLFFRLDKEEVPS